MRFGASAKFQSGRFAARLARGSALSSLTRSLNINALIQTNAAIIYHVSSEYVLSTKD